MSNIWSFSSIWNKALDAQPRHEYAARDYIYASELGGSLYDRYFKMHGRKPTTPPNLRSRRKFEGGNLTEWIVEQVLSRAGLLRSVQEYITYEQGLMKVTGRADFVAGGEAVSFSDFQYYDLPETFQAVAKSVLQQLQKKYPNGLPLMNMEVKSCSGQLFERYAEAPNVLHGLQAFHYAFNTKRPTMLVYVSRDDFRIAEWVIAPGSKKWLELYEADIAKMYDVYWSSKMAVKEDYKEPLLTWDGDKFQKNWKIEYSNWLTDYGYKRPDEYAKPAQSVALRLTNIVKKIKEGKPIDGKVNQNTLSECYAFYSDAKQIIIKLQGEYSGTNN